MTASTVLPAEDFPTAWPMPAHGLPAGWAAVRLGDVAAPRGEAIEPREAPEQNYVGLEHIESGRNRIEQWGNANEVKSLRNRFRAGDVLYGKLRRYLDKAALAEWPGICSTDIIVIVPSAAVDAVFLTHLIHTRPFIDWAVSRSRGINLPRTTWKDLQEIIIPLPPRAEQRRIVTVVEAVLARVNAARARLARVREVLRRYRAAVLNAAVEGRLTEDWRAAHPDVEPAEVLLRRILEERRRRWEEAERARYVKTGKTPPLDWRSRYKELEPPDTSELPELPDGWCWTSMGQAFGVYVGATPSRKETGFWGGDIPWVSSGEVAFCTITHTRESITEAGLRNTSTEVHPIGTVLLGMIGEGRTRGQAAILGIPACNNQNAAAIRVSEASLPPEYIFRFLEGQYERTRNLGAGNNQPALNKSRVESITFPLPPLAEQLEMVQRVERLMYLADTIEARVERAASRAEQTAQAVLAKAFRGELVPQDPADEQAAVTLERQRANVPDALA